MNQQSKIGGLSPGPMYAPDVWHASPKYTFGMTRVTLDKQGYKPGPGTHEKAPVPTLGFQRIDSSIKSYAQWGFGSGTRDHQEGVHMGKFHTSNNSSAVILGGGHVPTVHKLETSSHTAAAGEPSRASMSRALAVAMAAGGDGDPALASALDSLRSRVTHLSQQR